MLKLIENWLKMSSFMLIHQVVTGPWNISHTELLSHMLTSVSLPSSLTLLLLNATCSVLANSVDPDQLASEEANWFGSALFVIKYVNFYQKLGSSNLIGWKLEVDVAS